MQAIMLGWDQRFKLQEDGGWSVIDGWSKLKTLEAYELKVIFATTTYLEYLLLLPVQEIYVFSKCFYQTLHRILSN